MGSGFRVCRETHIRQDTYQDVLARTVTWYLPQAAHMKPHTQPAGLLVGKCGM